MQKYFLRGIGRYFQRLCLITSKSTIFLGILVSTIHHVDSLHKTNVRNRLKRELNGMKFGNYIFGIFNTGAVKYPVTVFWKTTLRLK